ncbi:ATP synthase C chain [hydrothermal vent metagenome]|uniref:ATP synthase C chain n=1 Tax=hydrothermal vent metagenome TaxID=652676 RepID=A0A3B1BQ60_9ZZZZ
MNKKHLVAALLVFVAVMVFAPMAFASEGAAVVGSEGRYAGFFSYIALGCVLGLGLAAAGGGIGMGAAVSGAVNAMSRNPGFYGRIFTSMLIGLALIESLVIYTLVVVLLLLFANPLV